MTTCSTSVAASAGSPYPLAGYLTDAGSYRGFDVVPAGVDWCRRHISSRYPNFRFDLADLANTRYRRRSGRGRGRLPFPL